MSDPDGKAVAALPATVRPIGRAGGRDAGASRLSDKFGAVAKFRPAPAA